MIGTFSVKNFKLGPINGIRGKKRLSGDTERNATTDEVQYLKKENDSLKKAIADLYLHNESLKKSLTGLD